MLAIGLGTAVQAAVPGGTVDDFIDREMPVSGVPGLAYAVVGDGAITTVGARGVLRIGGDKKVTPDTPFLVGSVSKSFTALAVMQLVEARKVDLDTAISHYLNVFSSRPAGSITIRQLLSHTSGFSTLQGNSSHTDSTDASDELARRVAQVARLVPAHSPGAKWEYSNLNYQILGRLIEVVSGQEYQTYVATNILEPIGMEHSFVADGKIHEAMATGHRPWFGTKRPLALNKTDRGSAPQGGIVASARDLARYMNVMMNGKDDVLSAGGKAAMMQPASDVSPFYGFGWFVDEASGSVWHSGASPDSSRSRRWSRPSTKASWCWPTRPTDWVSARRRSSSMASPPGPSAWTTTGNPAAGRRSPCSLRWPSCRSCSCSASFGHGAIATRYAPSRARSACSASGFRS